MHNVNNKFSHDTLDFIDESSIDDLADKLSNFNWRNSIVEHSKHLLYSQNHHDNIKGVLNLKTMLCIDREEVYEVAQEVIDHGIISQLVNFLKKDNKDLQLPAAFCLTNIAAGHDTQTQIVVDAGAIPCLIQFLKHPDSQLRRQAIYCLANIAGSTKEIRMFLVQNPDYFNAIINAGSLTMDVRVLELICWNLRNICLLGGPTLDEIKPGIDYLLNGVLKRYIHNHAWNGCIKYALETLSSICKTPQGLELMIENNFSECLVGTIIEHCCTCNQLVESAFDALSHVLLWGVHKDRVLFSKNTTLSDIILSKAMIGELGTSIQESSLKCMVALCLDSDENVFLNFISHDQNTYELMANLYLNLVENTAPLEKNTTHSCGKNSELQEMCAFIFVKALLLSRHIISIHMSLILSPMVIRLLINIIEFAVEREYNCYKSENNFENKLPMRLPEKLILCALTVLRDYILEGFLLQTSENLPENPVISNCIANDYINCMKQIILKTPLSEESHKLCNEILQKR